MKVEIKTNEYGICEYFKINDKKYGEGIYELNIKVSAGERTEVIIKARTDEFILDSENTKLYLEKKEGEK